MPHPICHTLSPLSSASNTTFQRVRVTPAVNQLLAERCQSFLTGYFPWTVLVSVYRPYEPFHATKVPPVAVFTNEKGEILRQMTLVAADGSAIDENGQVVGAAATLQYAIVGVNMAVSTRLVVAVLEESQTVLHYFYIRDLVLDIAYHRDDPPARRRAAGVCVCLRCACACSVCARTVCVLALCVRALCAVYVCVRVRVSVCVTVCVA